PLGQPCVLRLRFSRFVQHCESGAALRSSLAHRVAPSKRNSGACRGPRLSAAVVLLHPAYDIHALVAPNFRRFLCASLLLPFSCSAPRLLLKQLLSLRQPATPALWLKRSRFPPEPSC